MVKHLGRLKVVVRRKDGECGYPDCSKDRKIVPGDKVFLLTRGGSLPNRPFVIFQSIFHRDCFGPYVLYRFDKLEMVPTGRPPVIQLDPVIKNRRKNWLHERSKLIRSLKNIQQTDQLSRVIGQIDRINKKVEATGYPISGYGRRSKNDVLFGKFIKLMKKRWAAPSDIKRRLPAQVEWAVEQMIENGIIDKEEAVESVFIEWQEDVDRKLEIDKGKHPTYEEVEERKLE